MGPLPNAVSMLGQRLRRWTNIETALGECPVFEWVPPNNRLISVTDSESYRSTVNKRCMIWIDLLGLTVTCDTWYLGSLGASQS